MRGPGGESAHSVLSRVTESNRYRFDQACRVKAIKTAASLGMQTRLSINFLPNAISRPEVCIRTTLEAARRKSACRRLGIRDQLPVHSRQSTSRRRLNRVLNGYNFTEHARHAIVRVQMPAARPAQSRAAIPSAAR